MPFFPDCSMGSPARLLAVAIILGAACTGPVRAQTEPDPVLATVNGQPIHLSDVTAATETLPAQARSLPPKELYPMMLNQLVDQAALVVEAKKAGLETDPAVQRAVHIAEDRALASAYLSKQVRPLVTEEAVKAKYDKDFANKPGVEEVHARHILVGDEATAKKIIAELKKGGDFAALSKQYSKDPSASAQGGDLGFFKKTDMVPEFADAAFALKDKEISPVPVKSQFGWHVIQTLEHRTSAPPSFEQERDELRQQMVQTAVQSELAQARAAVTVEKFNPDGTPVRTTDSAEPPPATPATK